jgi:predicted transcriptional regulator
MTAEISLVDKGLRSKRRSDDVIVSQILGICIAGAGKTRILYQANLNSTSVNHFLEKLVINGFIEEVPRGARILYKTTLKGEELKEKLDRLQNEMNELHSHFSRLRPEISFL